jgi:hypothetical protein
LIAVLVEIIAEYLIPVYLFYRRFALCPMPYRATSLLERREALKNSQTTGVRFSPLATLGPGISADFYARQYRYIAVDKTMNVAH